MGERVPLAVVAVLHDGIDNVITYVHGEISGADAFASKQVRNFLLRNLTDMLLAQATEGDDVLKSIQQLHLEDSLSF